jgi:alkylated DNA repair dioxygenase AlkB
MFVVNRRTSCTTKDKTMQERKEIIRDVHYIPNYSGKEESDKLLIALLNDTDWRHETITVRGMKVLQSRLSATQGEPGAVILYNGRSFEPAPWSPAVLAIKQRIETEVGAVLNSVLMNLYRNGQGGVAYHTDDDDGLGGDQTIVSVTFGASRRFLLKHRNKSAGEATRALDLGHGDVLIMGMYLLWPARRRSAGYTACRRPRSRWDNA